MRRKSTLSLPAAQSFDIKKDLAQDHLAEFGAVLLAWNDAEHIVNILLCVSLDLDWSLWTDVSSRINGMDGKIEIIKSALKSKWLVQEEAYGLLAPPLGYFLDYKKYRDGVIHARMLGPNIDIAPTILQRGKIDEVLISAKALSVLYELLVHLAKELDQVLRFVFARSDSLFKKAEGASDDEIQSVLQGCLAASSQLLDLQEKRKHLPSPPEFPDLSLVPPWTEGPLMPAG